MLCSSVIKERLYIGEATVATLCGIIFGPHAANLINPASWGHVDQVTLEFSRIVLVVQCFAVGVELPKAYMERHWRSVTFLLVPVMTFGWLITSLFIWAVFHGNLDWLESLTVAACVTATDPVLASSVVGKGKFAKRVPKHLRDLLSAESGCNDGMAFPFIYLALYILKYKPHVGEVFEHWICVTILYECVFGCIYGVVIGYTARRLIRYAHEHDIIDRESFLVFYFVLALFCAGSGSLLGMDDLLVGFACGVGFSNDGWFTEKTEESHVSNVIDLLINLTFFVYFGTIIPWEQYNAGVYGLDVWKLVVIGILVLFFRRIPIMLMLKPFIPDIKTWREALFAGHFGPIGVGAIFVAILARAELETGTTTPLDQLPDPATTPEYNVIYLIWPITTFLVICSIVVHGSSIAVFTLGKHINTLTLTMSYTQANEQGPSWMDRLPRIQSRSKSSMSMQSFDEKSPMGQDPPLAPGTFLRRQREEDGNGRARSRQSSRHRSRHSRGRSWDIKQGPGGPISQSAIAPTSRSRRASPENGKESRSDSETLAIKSDPPSDEQTPETDVKKGLHQMNSAGEIFEEGGQTVYEDEEGNVLAVERTTSHGAEREADERQEGERLMHREGADHNHGVAPTKDDPDRNTADEVRDEVKHLGHEIEGKSNVKSSSERPGKGWREGWNKMSTMAGSTMVGMRRREGADKPKPQAEKKEARGPARAYQYGNTIIVEDEDGEVIKKYDIPAPDRKGSVAADPEKSQKRVAQMSKMLGVSRNKEGKAEASASASSPPGATVDKKGSDSRGEDDDHRIRFMMQGGRRMSKAEFIDHIRTMDPKSRVEAVEDSNAPEAVKNEARKEAREQAVAARSAGANRPRGQSLQVSQVPVLPEEQPRREEDGDMAAIEPVRTNSSNELRLVDSNKREVPFHDIGDEIRRHRRPGDQGETAAERRRRLALQRETQDDSDSEDDGTDRVPPRARSGTESSDHQPADDQNETAAERRRREGALGISSSQPSEAEGETAAERRRREGALGVSAQDSDSEDDDAGPRDAPQRQSIRFADQAQEAASNTTPRQSTLRWGKNVGR